MKSRITTTETNGRLTISTSLQGQSMHRDKEELQLWLHMNSVACSEALYQHTLGHLWKKITLWIKINVFETSSPLFWKKKKKKKKKTGPKLGITDCIALHCIVLCCVVLCCVVLCCVVLYCIVLYCIVLYCIVLYCIVLSSRSNPARNHV